jgi:adenosylhomocysteine nucleosidase
MTDKTAHPPIGTLGGRSVLFAMAVEAEYGPHLKKRFQPLITGVGPVEAAISVTAALAELEAADRLPSLLVSLGSAGSRVLDHAEVYQVSEVSYRDMDASPLGFDKGVTPFLDLPAVLPMPLVVPGLKRAGLSTGGGVISGIGYDAVLAEMVDMETYAVVRAAARFSIPVVALRGISDGRAELRQMSDWTEYLHVVDEKLAWAVDRMAEAIEDGRLPA